MRILAVIAVFAGLVVMLAWQAGSQAADLDALAPRVAPTAPATRSGLPFYSDARFTPTWNGETAHRVGSFSLVDQAGHGVNERALDGRITVVGFFYTTCHGICASSTENLAWLQARTAACPDVQIFSHSVTGDGIEALARYGRFHGIDPRRWHLLTGDLAAIDDVMRNGYLSYPSGDVAAGRASMHTENLLLVDGRRRIRGVYRGTLRLDVERLAGDIQALRLERSDAAAESSDGPGVALARGDKAAHGRERER